MQQARISKAAFLAGLWFALATTAQAQNYSRTEVITYSDNTAKWVLGQVATVSIDGTQVAGTDYDATYALPIKTYSFGKLQNTLGYYTDGTLATVKDGRNNVTTLSSWKRGIPQGVQHPDGTSEAAFVNDNGWITSATDENTYTTNYTYDPMGRLASIAYPTADNVAWNTTTQVFAPVAATEYGIPSGHWKKTVSTGNARKVTYFDALWRPLVTEQFDNADAANTRSISVTRYDADGHPAYQSYPLNTLSSYATPTQGTRTTYDPLDRVTRVEQDSELGILASTWVYQSGFKTLATNPRGFQTTSSYLTYDQPSTDWPIAITHPEGANTDIARDAFGKPMQITRGAAP